MNINIQKDDVLKKIKEHATNLLNNTHLTFIRNMGQVDAEVEYYIKGNGYTFYFTKKEIKYSFIRSKMESNNENNKKEFASKIPKEAMRVTVAQEFINVNPEVKIEPIDRRSETVNYFKGNNPAKWKTLIPSYEKIIYREIWKGIDLVFYENNGKLKYEFIIHPNASIENIKFIYKDSYETLIDDRGNLIIKTPMGDLVDEKPICYQQIQGNKVIVKGFYDENKKENQIFYSYKIDSYDKNSSLVIDPGIIYSSYLGGSGLDRGWSVAIDQSGNAYISGYTDSSDFPLVNEFQSTQVGQDAFVTKIDTTPAIVYSSYLGGSGTDRATEVAVDQSGNVYVTGYTDSTDFPTVSAFQPSYGGGTNDVFITKIDSTPAIVYSSYLGGTDDDQGDGLAVDQNGNAYIAGYTASSNFPTLNAFQPSYGGGGRDAFITKIDSTPAIVYSSFLGGNANDFAYALAVDQSGNAYVAGSTNSPNFPTVSPFQGSLLGSVNAFITKVNFTPSIVYSSYLGGSGTDSSYAVTVDQNNNAYLTGTTNSPNFPSVNAFQVSISGANDAFITKVDSAPSIVYSSYLGGSLNDAGTGIKVDQNNNAYVTGRTSSTNFPTVNAFQSSYGGGTSDSFITKINDSPAIVYSSYLGGSGNDRSESIAIDQGGNAFLAGYTDSTDFPIVNAFQSSYGGGTNDAFITKISGLITLQISAANLTIEVI